MTNGTTGSGNRPNPPKKLHMKFDLENTTEPFEEKNFNGNPMDPATTLTIDENTIVKTIIIYENPPDDNKGRGQQVCIQHNGKIYCYKA